MPGAGSRRSRQVSRPRRASRASHAPVSARVVVLTVAGGSTGLVVYCTTHLPQGRPRQGAPVAQGVPLALGRRQVERLPHTRRVLGGGWLCGAHRACAAAATTKHLHAYACEGADENSWQSRPRHTRAPCQQQSLVVCLAGSASASLSAQPPKSECVQQLVANIRSCPTFLAIVLTSSSNMTRARSAAVSLGGGSRPSVGLKTACLGLDCHEFSSAPSRTKACKRLVNTFFAWTYVPSQGADDDLRGAQADRVEPAHGVLPNPRALQVVNTKRPHDPNTHR
jgi:hypothetical protein